MGLNDVVVSKTKVRRGVYAYRLLNGGRSIKDELYMFYPIKEAIRLWRNKNPLR